MQLIGLIIATALLNIGLFFLLWLFTPIVSGIICGYLAGKSKEGIIIVFVGSLISYLPLFLYSEILSGNPIDILAILIALIIISFGGAFGGYLGGAFREKKST